MSNVSAFAFSSGEALKATAVSTIANLKQIQMAAIAIANASDLVDNYKKQKAIAERSTALAAAQQAQLSSVFWPRENQFLNEFANPEAIDSIETMGRRYSGRLVSAVAGGFAQKMHEAKCSATRHCTSANKKVLQDLHLAKAFAMANARILGRKIAFLEWHARNDANWEKRQQAVALGRGLMGQTAGLLGHGGASLIASSKAIASELSSAVEAFGYYGERRPQQASYMQTFGTEPPVEEGIVDSFTRRGDNQSPQTSIVGDVWRDVPPEISQETPIDTGSDGQTDLMSLFAERGNDASVGHIDKARTGVLPFPVIGGGGGTVTVAMDLFPLGFVDQYPAGAFGPGLFV